MLFLWPLCPTVLAATDQVCPELPVTARHGWQAVSPTDNKHNDHYQMFSFAHIASFAIQVTIALIFGPDHAQNDMFKVTSAYQ